MIFPGKLDSKYAKASIEATRIAAHVKNTGNTVKQANVGDFVVIPFKNGDKFGKITEIRRTIRGMVGHYLVSLQTNSGIEQIKAKKNSLIYIMKKADMGLREHDSYERDLHSLDNKGVPVTDKDDHHNFPPTTKDEPCVSKDKESALPATKKLSLRQNKAYQFAAMDIVYSSSGIPAQIIEILPGDETQAAMAILRSVNGESHFVEFLTDLAPVVPSKKLALSDSMSSNDIAKKNYGKQYSSLSSLEKLDVDDNILKLN